MQPTLTYLPEHTMSDNVMDEDNNIIPQSSQTIQSCEPFNNMEISNANRKLTEEIHNENCTDSLEISLEVSREINSDLDTIVSALQSENSMSKIGMNNVTTAAYNIQNVKEHWSEDNTVNVMDYTIEESNNFEPNNIVCPITNTVVENNLKSSEIVTTLDSNQTSLFDFEAVINSAVTSVDTLEENTQQSVHNSSITGIKKETSVTEKVILEPVTPHNNQQFSFEITASSIENDTGKPMTITITPIIEIEPKPNIETKDTALPHGKK